MDFKLPIRNVDRTVGAMLSGEIARKYGRTGLPAETIHFTFIGSAGQSFGAFLAHGVTLELEGDTNDYAGKGLSGGKLIVYPPRNSTFPPEKNILIGNTVLYGATSGEAFFNGVAGERYAVRNSGATSVVEGVGDHGCEYMTKGLVIVLGETGKNFAAGMTGGIAFVLDETGEFTKTRCNPASVDLEPVEEAKDIEELRYWIARHAEETGSPRANWILENWDSLLPKFVKVFPHEYKRVLGVPRRQAAGGAWVKSPASWSTRASCPRGGRWRSASTTGSRFTRTSRSRKSSSRARAAWIAAFRSATPAVRSPTSFRTGTIWCIRGRWQEAVRVLHSTNNFPEFTGRICPAPCEAACVLGINEPPVAIKVIERSIIDYAYEHGWIVPEASGDAHGQESRGDRERSGGAGGGAATGARGALGYGVRESAIASAACCATAFRISRWRSIGSTGAWSRWRPKASSS